MSRSEQLFIGFEIGSGEPVYIPIFHTLITGQTQLSGKTTLLRALARRVIEKGYKILVLDSKTGMTVEDYEGFGQNISICLRQSTDALVLRGLLESIYERKLMPHYATLTRITQDAKSFEDILENARVRQRKSHSGFEIDICETLIDLITRLIAQTKKVATSTTLELPYDINRMSINMFDLAGQQLIAKATFEEALSKYKKIIIVLDEASKFIPQKWSSACHKSIQNYVTQSAANKGYVWLSTQFLATTSKDQMKAMAVKLLGRQDHDTECQHTLDLIPFTHKQFSANTIMRLKLGHFVGVLNNEVKIIYVCPEYADTNQCREVALGVREPRDITYLVPLTGDQYQTVKEKHPSVKIKPIEKPTTITTIKVEKAVPKPVVEPIPIPDVIDKTEKALIEKTHELKRRKEPKQKFVKPRPFTNYGERFELLENNLDAVRQRLISVEELLEALGVPKDINLSVEQPKLNVKVPEKTIDLDAASPLGRLAICLNEGLLPSDWATSGGFMKVMENRFAAKESPNGVSKALAEMVVYKYLERRMRGTVAEYKVMKK